MNTNEEKIKCLYELLDLVRNNHKSLQFIYSQTFNDNNWESTPHSLDYYELSYYSGKINIRSGDDSFNLGVSCITLFNIYKGMKVNLLSGNYHYLTFRIIKDCLKTDLKQSLDRIASVLERGIPVHNSLSFENIFLELSNEFIMKKPLYEYRISLIMQEIIIYSIRSLELYSSNYDFVTNNKNIGIVNSINTFLNKNYMNKIKLEDFSLSFSLTPRYIDHIYKQLSGSTIVQQLNKIRLEASMRQIIMSNKSMTEIALDSGFDNSSYFCKMFKKAVGMSPATYRSVNSMKL
ncbi:MAG TPA: helix-turn-helix transcriptional regulator [Ruminiclostridium sp.]